MAKESENKEISGKSQVDKKTSTAAGVGCLVVLIVIIVIIGFKFFGSSSKPSSWPTSEITPETVTAALREDSGLNPIWQCRNFKDNIVKVEVIDSAINPGHKNLSVFFKIGQVWDETDLVQRVGGTVLSACSILYQNPKVDTVGMFALGEMTDKYGNSSLETVVKIIFNRDIANKINWKGFTEQFNVDPGNIYRIAESYHIRYGILKYVKLDKVKLIE